jgi:very-short-patch-repair endonuclease
MCALPFDRVRFVQRTAPSLAQGDFRTVWGPESPRVSAKGLARDVLHRERRLAALAARQHGVVTLAQLAGLGIGRRAVAGRVTAGRLRRLHRGVYLVGPLEVPLARELAAVLACGERAVLSHRAAAALWGLRRASGGDVDVTVGDADVRSRPGIRVHRTRRLRRGEATRRQRIPVTTPARTLFDLATVVDGQELGRALEQAEILRLVTPGGLEALLRAQRGRAGARALRRALDHRAGPALTRSEAEARLLALVRAARLPAPAANARVGRFEVDLLWSAERLVVEVDGYAFHATPEAFERDRSRDAELQVAGYRVLRVTWSQIVREPEALVARLAVALAA